MSFCIISFDVQNKGQLKSSNYTQRITERNNSFNYLRPTDIKDFILKRRLKLGPNFVTLETKQSTIDEFRGAPTSETPGSISDWGNVHKLTFL